MFFDSRFNPTDDAALRRSLPARFVYDAGTPLPNPAWLHFTHTHCCTFTARIEATRHYYGYLP